MPTGVDYAAIGGIFGNSKGGLRPNDLDQDCDENQGTPPPSSTEETDSEGSDVDSNAETYTYGYIHGGQDADETGIGLESQSESEAGDYSRLRSSSLPAHPTAPRRSEADDNGELSHVSPWFGKFIFLDESDDEDKQSDVEVSLDTRDHMNATKLLRTIDFVFESGQSRPVSRSKSNFVNILSPCRARSEVDNACMPSSSFVTPGFFKSSNSSSSIDACRSVSQHEIVDLTAIDGEGDVEEGSGREETSEPKLFDSVQCASDSGPREALVQNLGLGLQRNRIPQENFKRRRDDHESEPCENRKRRLTNSPLGL